jgi:hypothetical protein
LEELEMSGPALIPATNPGVAATWQTVFDIGTGDLDGVGYYTYCIRQVFASTAYSLTLSGSKMRVTIRARAGEDYRLTESFVGVKAGAGDAYDYASAPTRITWSGANGVTVPAGTSVVSDEITMTYDTSQSHVFGFDHVQTAPCGPRCKDIQTGCSLFIQVIDGDAATVNASGYTDSSATFNVMGIMKIEVFA